QKPYGTLVCYAKQEAKTCADYGYVASCPSGQTGTAHSVKLGSTTGTCYSDCKADSYFELTSCRHDSNTQFTVYYKYSTSTDDVIDCRSQDGITGETYSETSASKDNTTGSFIVQFNADCDGTGCEIECGLGKSSSSSIITCLDDSSGGSGNTCHESCISDCEQQYQNSCSWGNATDCQSLANCVSWCGGANSCVGDDCRRYCP
ncbi:MAG: hypothetical protein J6B00_00450, partial [Alphaproteobacteria bacterium]|nr:hypothetical protein [Alphaproteobacteria bacterium]